ncbi:hypothetical protein WAF17_00910 [Bernardetia sp. ABR2-2B]|uniref:hypothetical protein n=1 Tax=Bernardetia sp. ABR2-2B TaxID=3127472 RepID=UPI0030CBA9E3
MIYKKLIYLCVLLFLISCNSEQKINENVNSKVEIDSSFTEIVADSINAEQKEKNTKKWNLRKPTDTKNTKVTRIINIISQNVDYAHEGGGRKSADIMSLVWDVVYNDDTVSDELKFELLHIMSYYKESARRPFRAYLFSEIREHNPKVLANIEFAIPFILCHYCQSTEVVKIIKNTPTKLENEDIPPYYIEHNKKIWEIIEQVDTSKEEDKILNSYNRNHFIIDYYLKRKYPQLPKSMEYPHQD